MHGGYPGVCRKGGGGGGGYKLQSDLGLIMQYMVTKATRHQRNRNQE